MSVLEICRGRGLATLRDTCPNGKRNFYTAVHGG